MKQKTRFKNLEILVTGKIPKFYPAWNFQLDVNK